jgi:phosphoribosylamine-glycine ligase
VFHAGTSVSDNRLITSGGRVLAVSAYATTLQEALNAAYAGIDKIDFEGKTYRRDIAHRYVFFLDNNVNFSSGKFSKEQLMLQELQLVT